MRGKRNLSLLFFILDSDLDEASNIVILLHYPKYTWVRGMWNQRKTSPASWCENEELSEHVLPVLTCWQSGPPPIVHWPSTSHSPEQREVVTLTYSRAIKSHTFPLPLWMKFRISLVQLIMENIFLPPNQTDRGDMKGCHTFPVLRVINLYPPIPCIVKFDWP